MRLISLTLSGFKNLRELNLEFNVGFDTLVMLGGNGTGKSNLIEALVAIFADVDLARRPVFNYDLRYSCRGHHVRIVGSATKRSPAVTVDGASRPLRNDDESVPDYLPDHVIAYYSGPGSRLESHFRDHARREYAMLRDPTTATYSPFLYCEPCYSDFLLLASFASGAFRLREFVSGRMHIDGIESVLFDITKPRLRPTRSQEISEIEGDDRFWNATGEAAEILGLLWDFSLAPRRERVPDLNGFPVRRVREHVYLYLKDQGALRNAARPFGKSYGFFRHLCYLNTLGMLDNTTVMIRRRGQPDTIAFSELSEGERQLITTVGLMNMSEGTESLILLDEPDTHLNPQWKYDYLRILHRHAGESHNSQVILATHDPLIIGELVREQVFVFHFDDDRSAISVCHPAEDPKGKGVAGLLKSNLFGLRSTLDVDTLEKLDRRYELYSLGEDRTPEQTSEMHGLIDELVELGFVAEFRDPYYEQFARAMARRSEFRKPKLSSEEREQQEQIADEILDQILGDQEREIHSHPTD